MNTFKKLAGDTVIYGMSSIVGRILNWCLAPYYMVIFAPEDFGIMTNLYQYVAFFMILLTYGMETSFFRYASKSENPDKVYSTVLISLFSTSVIFVIPFFFISDFVANILQYPGHPEYILWLAIILGIDALTAIPFARLRLNSRPVRFATIKMVNIGFNIVFNLFFLSLCPYLLKINPDSFVNLFYSPEVGVGYVFIANLLASVSTLILLLPEMLKITFQFDKKQLAVMLNYGFAIMIVGLAGMVSQGIDKILIPFLVPESQNPMQQLGIYGGNFKVAILMNVFIQAFRYAFEPFFFSQGSKKDDPKIYAVIMKYFVIFGLLIFLGMMLYVDLLKIIIQKDYQEGMKAIPLILMANLFFGIYFTLSLWYKLTDKTRYGAYIAIAGAVITVVLNVLLIPSMGYMGSAISAFIGFFIMMLISYYFGQKYYPVPYPVKRILTYFLIAAILYFISLYTSSFAPVLKYLSSTLLLFIFFASVFIFEKNELKGLFKFNKKN
ncbi:MAG: polysaccharide biosynthesis C-terminal domain-containing protein [Draconibacterium sp.]|nr:polysaccharide biosynthesis C-terminal domain-containing protein [Draconibacterium sp.]